MKLNEVYVPLKKKGIRSSRKWGVAGIGFLVFLLLGIFSSAFAQSEKLSLRPEPVLIPGGETGIGFDDLIYSPSLKKILVPAGHTGKLFLIDSNTQEMTKMEGFSSSREKPKGRGVGISSADEGGGYFFVADHGRHELDAVSVNSGKIVAALPLAGDSDYVRYVGPQTEVWVTEPRLQQIEVFKFSAGNKPSLTSLGTIPVAEGPESLVIDETHLRAYTNTDKETVAIDVSTHSILARWPNSCERARGLALDEARGFLFVGCGEGKAVVLDLNHNGKPLSQTPTAPGVDILSYNGKLSHLYLTGMLKAILSVLGVSNQGQLSPLGTGPAAPRAHCVVNDDQNHIWVCDPSHGQLLKYQDIFPPTP